MKPKTLLSILLLATAPSLLVAQPQPPAEPPAPEVPATPAGIITPARPAMVPIALVPPASAPAIPSVPSGVVRPAFAAVAPVPATPPLPPEVMVENPQTPPPPPAPKPAPAAPVATTAPVAPAAPPRAPAQMVNVQIEVTLADTKGTPKTVVLTVADGELGQNRTNSAINVATAGTSYSTFTFNADARPSIVGNRIRLFLSAEANIPASPDAKAGMAANISLRQQQTLVLSDGDSVEIARASDPVSDRNFTLSVKVKIQR